jgi:hypothetical protein
MAAQIAAMETSNHKLVYSESIDNCRVRYYTVREGIEFSVYEVEADAEMFAWNWTSPTLEAARKQARTVVRRANKIRKDRESRGT